MEQGEIRTWGELKTSGYKSKSIKEELRENLIDAIQKKRNVFDEVVGFEDTVMPEIQRAILAGHHINMLGLRGQAKTSIARMMTRLLDEYIPAIDGPELFDDPANPISFEGRKMRDEMGDKTPIRWIHRDERYTEKLATPDVNVADLIGDIDPIKAANLKLSYSDEGALHFGLVPRAHRGIFVINELPDLQPRIQVALFNILQEGDIQIRGFKMRLPLDIQFVFTANPEDYTNRGAIITPLKDRIQSQIITHYPQSIEAAKTITRQQAQLTDAQREKVIVPELVADLIEQITFAARDSDLIDQRSGVSARLSISAYECLVASAERRAILNGETNAVARISDLVSVVPAITGKVELVYEGEQEGAIQVAHQLIRTAMRTEFLKHFPNPEKLKRKEEVSPFDSIVHWFVSNELELDNECSSDAYAAKLSEVHPAVQLVEETIGKVDPRIALIWTEFLLHSMAEYSLISKKLYQRRILFNDMLSGVLG